MLRLLLPALILASCAAPRAEGPRLELPPEVAAERADPLERHARPIMGTLVEIALPRTRSGPERQKALDAAWEAFAFGEREMNEWREDSPLSAINRNAGGAPVQVGPELFAVIERSLQFARLSDGAFDPTWAALRGLWRFGSAQDGTIPSDEAIEARRRLVDWRQVELDPQRRTVRLAMPGMALGLGGIAKGWAVDEAARRLRALGERDFLLEAGGELYAAGRPTPDGAWKAGVRDPRGNEPFALVELHDEACSTSGDYERAFVQDGVRYHHIIDPRTARPARASRSATVVAPHAVDSDALAKVAFILGAERAFRPIEEMGARALVVDAEGRVRISPAVSDRVQLLRQPTDTTP